MIAEVTFSTESLTIIGLLLAALTGAIGVLYRQNQVTNDLRITEHKARMEALESERDNWKQLSTEAVSNLRKAANAVRAKEGREPYPELEAVVPEHSSPATEEQKRTAELATTRAGLVAATKELGLDPRPSDVATKAAEVADRAVELRDELAEKAEHDKEQGE